MLFVVGQRAEKLSHPHGGNNTDRFDNVLVNAMYARKWPDKS